MQERQIANFQQPLFGRTVANIHFNDTTWQQLYHLLRKLISLSGSSFSLLLTQKTSSHSGCYHLRHLLLITRRRWILNWYCKVPLILFAHSAQKTAYKLSHLFLETNEDGFCSTIVMNREIIRQASVSDSSILLMLSFHPLEQQLLRCITHPWRLTSLTDSYFLLHR